MSTSLVGEVIELLLGISEMNIRSVLTEQPQIRAALSSWLLQVDSPISIGDALSRILLSDLLAVPASQDTIDYCVACKLTGGAFLPIPAADSRWGRVRPLADVFSTVQGTIMESLLANDTHVIARGRNVICGMIDGLPYNVAASDTEMRYRKLSEILLQAHFCATLASLQVSDGPTDQLRHAAAAVCSYAAGSPYALHFMSSIFRLTILSKMPSFRLYALPWRQDEVASAVERLTVGDGFAEYLLSDKVDERAGSRSRSLKDQNYPWTYSTAYGASVLALWGIRNTKIIQRIYNTLTNRLTHWPEAEVALMIKEFRTPFGGGATAYSAIAALAALSAGV
jgi:hypothetical protein